MSSTRRSTTGEFHQERFCSAPEFEGDAINGLAAAKRIALIKDKAIRALLWFIQWQSLTPGALQRLCDDLVASFPDRIGTFTLRKLAKKKPRSLTRSQIESLRVECGLFDRSYEAMLGRDSEFKLSEIPINQWELEFYQEHVRTETRELPSLLKHFCLDPKADISQGVWFFDDLLGALCTLRDQFIKKARSRLADTAVSALINETLDFWFSRRRMILIEGVAGIGRTETARAWRDSHAGLVRLVEVPSSADDKSFFASIARQLGVARGMSMKAQEIKIRIEEMLATSDVMLAFDESQYLWGQYVRPRKTPDRLLWIKTIFDSGTPIALIAHTDFSKLQAHYVSKTLWTDEQFERRLNRRVILPLEHSRDDMLKIARAHFPDGESRSWKLLGAYALGAEKKQASGIIEALESARYRANKAGRSNVTFAEIEAALIHDHHFMNAKTDDLQRGCTPAAKPVKRPRKPIFGDARTTQFSIPDRHRITTPIGAT